MLSKIQMIFPLSRIKSSLWSRVIGFFDYEKLVVLKCYNVVKRRNRLDEARSSEELRVAFLMLNVDSWKYDELISVLQECGRIQVMVVVCPMIVHGESFCRDQVLACVRHCTEQGYNYVVGGDFDVEDRKDLFKFDPHFLFFSNPNDLSHKGYRFHQFFDRITAYLPYSFRVDRLYRYDYGSTFSNLVDLNFCETKQHKKLARRYSKNLALNYRVSGHPQVDAVYNASANIDLCNWKGERLLVVWAPHWTVPGVRGAPINWSCFLEYCEYFLEFSRKYSRQFCFVMKPHPFLRNVLEGDALWGMYETELYFERWASNENCRIEVGGDYKPLFKSSDCLIHDSGSFMVEYSVVNRPMAYLANQSDLDSRFNVVGGAALAHHVIVESEKQLECFLFDVLNNRDSKKDKRLEFYNDYLAGSSSALNIVDEIDKVLGEGFCGRV